MREDTQSHPRMRAMRATNQHQQERNSDVPSAPGTGQEDYEEMPLPEYPAAVNKPLQPEPLLTRLRTRGALRRPERRIEQC